MSGKKYISEGLTLSSTQAALNRVKPKFETPGCTLAIITEDRYADAIDIVKNHFLPDEPLSNAFGVEWVADFENAVLGMLSQNLSVMMLSDADVDGDGRRRVMGIRITYAKQASDQSEPGSGDLTLSDILEDAGVGMTNKHFGITYQPLKDVISFLSKQNKSINFFGRYEVDEAMFFFAMATHGDFRKRGVAKKMFLASAALGAELGFKALKVEATSNYTQMICDKEGFQVLCDMPYDQHSYKGEVLRKKTGPHTAYKVYGKAL